MVPLIEIIVPVRNPTPVLLTTARSLAAQTERGFSMLLSDNSQGPAGAENLREAIALLEAAGVPVHTVRPPEDLGRVEHWNWSHRQSEAAWIKPLFTGDWLDPRYIAVTRGQIEAGTKAEIVNCGFATHFADGREEKTDYPTGYRSPEQFLAEAFRVGNNFGGPINVCFRRLSFDLVGGYPPAFPVSADFWLIAMLSLRGGLHTSGEVLGHFNFHPARFSSNFPLARLNGDRELFSILLAGTSYANFHELAAPIATRNRFYWFLFKRWLKSKLAATFHRSPSCSKS